MHYSKETCWARNSSYIICRVLVCHVFRDLWLHSTNCSYPVTVNIYCISPLSSGSSRSHRLQSSISFVRPSLYSTPLGHTWGLGGGLHWGAWVTLWNTRSLAVFIVLKWKDTPSIYIYIYTIMSVRITITIVYRLQKTGQPQMDSKLPKYLENVHLWSWTLTLL